MFQRQGRILKRGMKIRLAGMPGVAGFGKEAEIGQAVPPDQVQLFLKQFGLRLFIKRSVKKHQHQKKEMKKSIQKETSSIFA